MTPTLRHLRLLPLLLLPAACMTAPPPPPPAPVVVEAPPPPPPVVVAAPRVMAGTQHFRGPFSGGMAMLTVSTTRAGMSRFALTGKGRGCSYSFHGTAPAGTSPVDLQGVTLTRNGPSWMFAGTGDQANPKCTFEGELKHVRR